MATLDHGTGSAVLLRLARRDFDSKEWFDLKTQAEELSLTRGFDRLLSLETLGITLFEHQRRAVQRVLSVLRGRAVLADEVGLGKTIEAGVVLKEYLLRGLASRVLILTPASLVAQWRSELLEKLDVRVSVCRLPKDFARSERILASIDTAKRPACAAEVTGRKWDIVIVDEAHRLKNQRSVNWRFVNSIRTKYLLLLTATPVQNDLRELYNLVTLLKPGQLKTFTQFKKTFMIDKHSPKNTGELRRALGEVMVRTGRRESLIPFPKRRVETDTVALSGAERAYYNALLDELRKAYRALAKDERNVLPLILVLREACSHPLAAQKTLGAMCGRGAMATLTRARLEELARRVRELRPAKVEAFLRLVRGDFRPCVVFTEFRVTQRELLEALRAEGIPAFAFHGGLSPDEKEEAVAAFKAQGGVLVSTESGGEGRNLQFCSRVINFDLPWNPMRIEQRIGRVHRLGQRETVHVVNLVTEGTVDRYVLYLLEKKIGMFSQVIGEVEEILAGLEQSFERTVAEAVLESAGDEELAARIERFGDELQSAYARYTAVRRLNETLLAPVEESVSS